MNERIVVGLSDSPHSRAALDWALRRAELSGSPVEVVYVSERDVARGRVEADDGHHDLVLARDAFGASAKAPDVEVSTVLRRGRPLERLAEEARCSRMIVVGTHDADGGRHGARHSPAKDLAARSTVPVAVVPVPDAGHYTGVVVGVDGSPAASAAALFAARDAEELGEELTVMHVWTPAQAWVPGFAPDDDLDDARLAASRLLVSREVVLVRDEFPRLRIHAVSEAGDPATVLVHSGAGAREIVVGAASRHGLDRLLLGSVVHDTLRASARPIIIVPDPAAHSRTDPEPTAEVQE